MSRDERAALIEELTERVVELIDSTAIPKKVLQGLERSQRNQRIFSGVLAFCVFGIAILTGNLVYWSFQVQATQDKVQDTSCALYGLYVGSVTHPQPEQIDTPEEKARFDEAAEIILNIYDELGCQGATTG